MKKSKKVKESRTGSETKIKDILQYIREKSEIIITYIQKKIDDIKKEIIKRMVITILFLFGILFLLVGIAHLIANIFPAITLAGGYIIIGALLIIIGLIYRAGAKR